MGAGTVRFDDPMFERGYRPWDAYYQSKLANLLHLRAAVAPRGGRPGQHHRPGGAPGQRPHRALAPYPAPDADPVPARAADHDVLVRAERAGRALATLRAATDPAARGGEYYGPPGRLQYAGYPVRAESSAQSHDTAAARRLWELSEQLAGVSYRMLARSG